MNEMKYLLPSICAMAIAVSPAAAERLAAPDISASAATSSVVGVAAFRCRAPYPLRDKHQDLTQTLRDRLNQAGFEAALDDKDLAVAIVDLSDDEPVYAGINDTKMMYAASLPKIAIVLAAVQAVKDKRVRWSDELRTRLSRAINKSSNRDAAWGARQVGVRYIEKVLRRQGNCFYGNRNGGLWLGRPYTRRLPDHRDPVANLNHGATARQTARFYTLLAKGLLVDAEGNERILSLMSPPAITHKFVRGLVKRPVTFLARKSGSWSHFHSDSALIQHGELRYAVVALSRNVRNKRHRLEEIARAADDIIRARHSNHSTGSELGMAPARPQLHTIR